MLSLPVVGSVCVYICRWVWLCTRMCALMFCAVCAMRTVGRHYIAPRQFDLCRLGIPWTPSTTSCRSEIGRRSGVPRLPMRQHRVACTASLCLTSHRALEIRLPSDTIGGDVSAMLVAERPGGKSSRVGGLREWASCCVGRAADDSIAPCLGHSNR